MTHIVYFSSTSNYTHRFVGKLELPATRLPLYPHQAPVLMDKPFILIVPTYGGEKGARSVVPQVLRFLKEEQNRDHMLGVISCGNRNFGQNYCIAGDKIAAKVQVPHLYRLELMGTAEDVAAVRAIVKSGARGDET